MTYRFLDEYANHKKRQAKACLGKEVVAERIAYIERIVKRVHCGMITLDEAMRELSYL